MERFDIVVAVNNPYWVPTDSAYLPVYVGSAGKPSIGFQRDDEGDNISARNPHWCELTGLYWAWKNRSHAVLGLVHYRRHFKGIGGVLSKDECARLLENYNVILPKPRCYLIETSYSHYAHAHHAEDLDVTREIIGERCPEYLAAWDRCMQSSRGHRFNMFIMKRELAERYCKWLFDILFELERRLDISTYSQYDKRVFGFVAERMIDPWLETNGVAYKELPVLNLESQNWPSKIFRFILRKFGLGGRMP